MTDATSSSSRLGPARGAAPSRARRGRCYIVCPWGSVGGGMGRIMEYLMQAAAPMPASPGFVRIDPRGPGRALWSPCHLGLALLRIAWGAARGDVALVHVNVSERGSLARKGIILALARLLGIPSILHLHAAELLTSYSRTPRALRPLVRATFRAAGRCVVLGELWRQFLVEEFGVLPEKVVVLYNGVPRGTVAARPSQDGTARLLFLGNLSERKGVSDLIAALAMEPLRGLPVAATFAGGGPVEHYRALAETHGVLSRVRFTGWVDKAAAERLMGETDILVLPSYNEGLPLVVLEALSRGVAVVCTPVGAVPEVIEDGKTALLVPPGAPQGLAVAVARLVGDPALRARLAAEGRALYEKEFSVETFASRMLDIYRRLT